MTMASKRTYEDGCATAHGLDLIGERWALLVARELILGPKRFTDLRSGLPAISPNVLAQRLEELEDAKIVRRRKLPPPASAWVYELSEWGLELESVIMALGRWAVKSPGLMQGYPLSVDALVLSFRTMFSAEAAEGLDAVVELRINGDTFRAKIRKGDMALVRGSAENADAVIEGSTEAFVSVAYAGRKFADAVRAGDLKVTGDKTIAKRFFSLYPMPAVSEEASA